VEGARKIILLFFLVSNDLGYSKAAMDSTALNQDSRNVGQPDEPVKVLA
jgi:hypothetical protein